MKELLNIVDEDDNIIGEKSRVEIHTSGLLHREIHVYFITPNNELIFQHRAKDKDTFPDLLDATVGGHVEIGQSYEETAIKEVEEETGVRVSPADLVLIQKVKCCIEDQATSKINNAFTTRYLYYYSGDIASLRVEAGKALGFELWSIDSLLNLSETDKARFIPPILEFAITELVQFIKNNHK